MKCPRCQQENPTSLKFCGECGAPLQEASPTAESYADLKARVERLTGALSESLEQQTATGEILRVIASSPTDLQPVLDAVAQSAARLCNAYDAGIFRVDGNVLRLAAHHGPLAAPAGLVVPLIRGSAAGRAVIERRTFQVADLQAEVEEFPEGSGLARRFEYRTTLNVPLVREGVAIGVIVIRRSEVRPFAGKQVELVTTFADQAVIAIENVRLFTELQARNRDLTDALEQQTATSEILRVISQSPTDVQPVFDAIVRSGAALCHAPDFLILIADGDSLRVVASVGPVAAAAQKSQVLQDGHLPMTRGSVAGRAFIDRRTVHVHDVGAMPDDEFPEGKALQRAYGGHGTTLAVPLLRDNVALGVITLLRNEVSPFSDRQITLLQTFADQAVIAIENVRLFKELEARNRDLITALDRQTATSEILRVISQSQVDVQPVFDTIVQSAARLCHAASAGVFLTDGRTLDLPANYGSSSAEALATIRAQYPRPLDPGTTAGVAILTRSVIHVPDIEAPSAAEDYTRQVGRLLGVRSMVAVPMMRKGEVLGAINLSRREHGGFSDMEVELLKTFADQAVLAIENVRLFNETKEALDREIATSEILRVISSSPTDVQPVFDTIVRSAARLCDAVQSNLQRFDGEFLHLVATHNWPREGLDWARTLYPMRPHPSRGAGRAVQGRAVVHIPDVLEDPEYNPKSAREGGFRSLVSVPMLRHGQPIGVISVGKAAPGPFPDAQISLLQTFADQAVIAIENVRLFTELQEKNHALTKAHAQVTEALDQQTATAEILRTIAHA